MAEELRPTRLPDAVVFVIRMRRLLMLLYLGLIIVLAMGAAVLWVRPLEPFLAQIAAAAAVGFAVAGGAAWVRAGAACPRCGATFCGRFGSGQPRSGSVFALTCRQCGFSIGGLSR